MSKIGVLLINLGTPDAPTPEAVGRYLREFLMDGFVIDVPKPLRWFLVNVMIVPRRKVQSAKAYQKVQLPEGSPLLVYTRDFAEKVAAQLARQDDRYVVQYAMRYGNPSIKSALERMRAQDISKILVMPLYPQYAESSFETAVVETKKRAQETGLLDRLVFFPPFYDRTEFINAYANHVARAVSGEVIDHFVFSFHSLPIRHLKRLDATGRHCSVKPDCCREISAVNQNCYRAQCMFTARAMAEQLGLKEDGYSVSFQSRLGRAEWIGPQTEDLLRALAAKGVKRVAVACPSFVADCLETVEEIALRTRDAFLRVGGEELRLIPSLNSDPAWIDAVVSWIRESNLPA
ncbi:MAG: ferrochelatase [Acidobacteriota bacterium]